MIVGGYKGDSFVVQGTVLGAKSDEASAPSVGTTAAHVWSISGEKREIGRATWFGFLCGVYGVSQSEYTDAQWKQVSEKVIEGALNGTQVYLECWFNESAAPEIYTVHDWGQVNDALLSEFGVAA